MIYNTIVDQYIYKYTVQLPIYRDGNYYIIQESMYEANGGNEYGGGDEVKADGSSADQYMSFDDPHLQGLTIAPPHYPM